MTYKLSELKGKIRVGDEVRFEGEKSYRKVAFFDGARFITEDGYAFGFFGNESNSETVDLKPCPITWDNIKAGDFLSTEEKGMVKVLDVHGLIVDISDIDEYDVPLGGFTVKELKSNGYKIVKNPQEKKQVREVTMKDVCEKFGEEVKIKEE